MRDFHDHQENAYERTGRLTFLLSVAIVGTILCTGLMLAYVSLIVISIGGFAKETPLGLVFLCAFGVGSLLSAVAVLIGSLWKLGQLRDGGAVIAKDLGGELIAPGGTDLDRRKVLNIVEEMAIAASMPIPPVYLMDQEDGINAFAAGYSPRDAVLAVTRGCVKRLSRDQLQGVIAHEFSHILNGDIRLNLRTIGVLYGVLSITICAERMIHAGIELLEHPSEDGKTTGAGVILILMGAVTWPVGLIGVFFGVLIQAAMNRQREYLADASAVEFTRNPHGIADALKVIGGYDGGSRVRNPKAVEASHLFFAEGCRLASWLASHPPLEERIRRLDPEWDGIPIFESAEQLEPYYGVFEQTMNFVGGRTQSSPDHQMEQAEAVDESREDERAWQPSDGYTQEVATSMPSDLVSLAAESDAAGFMLLALWLGTHNDPTEAERLPDDSVDPTVALQPILEPLGLAQRLFLFDTSLAAIVRADSTTQEKFLAATQQMLKAPVHIDPFRRMWQQVIMARFHRKRTKPKYGSLKAVQRECEVLLSALVYAGAEQGMAAMYTFQRGAVHLELTDPELLIPDVCGQDQVDQALHRIAEVAASGQRQLSLACGACITSDHEVTEGEALMLREIYAELHLPNPSVLPGQPVIPGA